MEKKTLTPEEKSKLLDEVLAASSDPLATLLEIVKKMGKKEPS